MICVDNLENWTDFSILCDYNLLSMSKEHSSGKWECTILYTYRLTLSPNDTQLFVPKKSAP